MARSLIEARAWLADAEHKLVAAQVCGLERTDPLAFKRLQISVGVRRDMVRKLEREERRRAVYEQHA